MKDSRNIVLSPLITWSQSIARSVILLFLELLVRGEKINFLLLEKFKALCFPSIYVEVNIHLDT